MKNEDIEKVNNLIKNKDYAAVEKYMEEITADEEKDYNYWLLKAELAKINNKDEELLAAIENGMKELPTGPDMYNYLGDYYASSNRNKAYLCYEMAEFYCPDEAKAILKKKKDDFKKAGNVDVRQVSIVIPSYNCMRMMQNCIDSIRQTNIKESYEIVVVDNASDDGIREWLEEQDDVVLIENDYNTGFPVACNQGINASKSENDIFLLNNDTIVPLNAIFWLRMGLYESDKIGATGSVSNWVSNAQKVTIEQESVQAYIDFAYKYNTYKANPYEKKLYLVGFALLLKRTVLDKIGLLDEAFTPGNYEDNDIGFRVLEAGYLNLLCRNSFIYHYGHSSFKKDPEAFAKLLKKNRNYFKEKWGANFDYYSIIRGDVINVIKEPRDKLFRVLEVGCGAGTTLARIQYLYPNAIAKGIELNEHVARMAGHYVDIVQGNIETMELDFEEEYFDYVIFGDVLEHLTDPLEVIVKMKKYIKSGGHIIASIPNVLNKSVIVPLLQGIFQYKDAGLLDRTHCHLFTRFEAKRMFALAGYEVERIGIVENHEGMTKEQEEIYQALLNIPGVANEKDFEAYQYIFCVRKE